MQFAQPQFAVRKSLQVSRTISSGAKLDWGVRKMKVIIQLRAAARALSVTTNHLFLIFFLCLALPALAAAQDPLAPSYLPALDTNCADYPSNIWVTDSLTKVYQNSGNVGACPGATGNKWITIHGTQNEIVDFQVHFHDSGSGTSGYQVTVSSFVQTSPSSSTIAAPDSAHRDIVVYLEDYINVTTPSAVQMSGVPSYLSIMLPPGKIPDILVPAIDPYYHQTTNAMPMNISAGNNQSVWVDVHIPTTAPSGYYKGTVTVSHGCTGTYPGTGCTTLATLPIILAVWQWPNSGYMPSTATLQSFHIVGDGVCAQYYGTAYGSACGASWPSAGGDTTKAIVIAKTDFATLYLDHRLQGGQQVYSGPGSTYFSQYTATLLNGTANTILPGAKLNTIQWSNDGGSLQQWATYFQQNGWTPTLFNYSCDEPPNGCAWSNIYSNAQTLHALNPPMPALVTTSFYRMSASVQTAACGSATCLTNSVDWLVTNVSDMSNFEHANLAAYHTYQAGSSNIGTAPSRKWWSYSACDSTACGTVTSSNNSYALENPSNALDTTPIAHRVYTWFDMYSGQQGDLYFSDEICWSACGSNNGDPWQGVNYGGTNGDGTLVYPGRTVGNPTGFNNVGVSNPILLPSLRLKALRDGMQDYEYMNVLSAKGQGAVVTSAINSFMVTNNGQTGVNSGNWAFNNTSAPVNGVFTSDLPDARNTLGAAMHQLTYSNSLQPPPTLTGTLQ
jgi:hypothetical protein